MFKNFFLLCATICLLQFAVVLQAASQEELEDTVRNRLLIGIVVEYAEMATYTVDKLKSMFSNVLREGSPVRNKEVQTELSKLSEFNVKAKQLENLSEDERIDKLFELFEEGLNLLTGFDIEEVENPSQAIKEVDRLLKKHGVEEFSIEFLRRMLNLMSSINTKTETYINSLNDEERRNDKKLIDWYKKYQSEKNVEKKIDIVSEFFDVFDDEAKKPKTQ